MFEGTTWSSDRMTLNGWVFRLEHQRRDAWDGGDHFRFFKIETLIDAYERFFATHQVPTDHIFELGMWDGGSLAFWYETLQPKKLVGVDLQKRDDSPYFTRYVKERAVGDRIRSLWGVNQMDSERLREIVRTDFAERLDLVIDDASHLYGPSKASFETLFPYLRPGGYYIIEDWSWKHWEWFDPPPEWSADEPLTRLAVELTEAVGTAKGAVASVTAYPGFFAVERGARELPETGFRLEGEIHRREKSLPRRAWDRIVWGRQREALYRIKERIKRAL